MQLDTPHFRELEERDYSIMKRMIDEAWRFDRFSAHPRVVEAGLEVFLRSCLLEKNYSLVAEEHGIPVGCILGRIDRSYCVLNNIGHILPMMGAVLRIALRIYQGRKLLAQAFHIHRAYSRLMRTADREYDGEVVLFIVSEKNRGKGIGKELVSQFLDFCHGKRINRIFLYTDTQCSYGFYDTFGFKRRGDVQTKLTTLSDTRVLKVFMYEYQFKD